MQQNMVCHFEAAQLNDRSGIDVMRAISSAVRDSVPLYKYRTLHKMKTVVQKYKN
jgi:hypothetical protein